MCASPPRGGGRRHLPILPENAENPGHKLKAVPPPVLKSYPQRLVCRNRKLREALINREPLPSRFSEHSEGDDRIPKIRRKQEQSPSVSQHSQHTPHADDHYQVRIQYIESAYEH